MPNRLFQGPLTKGKLSVIVFCSVMLVYVVTFSFRPRTDTNLNSLQSRQIALHANVDLSRVNPQGGYYVHRGAQTYSIYGVGISIVALPFYFLLTRADAHESVLQGSVSIVAAACAVALILLALLHVAGSRRLALSGAVAMGFGTTLWPTGTTGLWQHAPVAAFESWGLLSLFSDSSRSPFITGFAFGAAGFVRLPTFLVAGVFVPHFAQEGRRRLIGYLLGMSPFLLATAVQNRWLWGSFRRTGYSYEPGTFTFGAAPHAFWEQLLGWRRGLFIYSPVFLLALGGALVALLVLKHDRKPLLLVIATLGLLIVDATHANWWGGENQFGYRYLIDAVPFLVVLAVIAVDRWRPLMPIMTALSALSVVFMAAGSSPNSTAWDTSYPQNAMSLSPLVHALDGATENAWPTISRLVLVLSLTLGIFLVLRMTRPAPGLAHSSQT